MRGSPGSTPDACTACRLEKITSATFAPAQPAPCVCDTARRGPGEVTRWPGMCSAKGKKLSATSRRRNDTTDRAGCENTADINAVVAQLPPLCLFFPSSSSVFFLLPVFTPPPPPPHTHSHTLLHLKLHYPLPLLPAKAQGPSPAHTLLLVSRRDRGVGQTVGERSRKPFPRPPPGANQVGTPLTPASDSLGGRKKKKDCILLRQAEEEKWNELF